MSFQATFRPIEHWPGKPTPSYSRRRSTFRASYADTLNLLEREIGKLSGKNVVIQVYLDRKDIRNDGWPRSSARPAQPGVIVSFHTSKGPLSFPCDRFDAWEDNLRAIALSLEALRQVDRYGVTKNAEQYKGFAQVEAPRPPGQMTEEEAAHFVGTQANVHPSAILSNAVHFDAAYRVAASVLHPDRLGTGSHELFVRLQAARQILRRRHGT